MAWKKEFESVGTRRGSAALKLVFELADFMVNLRLARKLRRLAARFLEDDLGPGLKTVRKTLGHPLLELTRCYAMLWVHISSPFIDLEFSICS